MGKHTEQLFTNIDWALLRNQKINLIEISELENLTSFQKEALDGILNIIDGLQDAVVDDDLFTELVVCGPMDEDD
jgi:hypothetical protein